MPKTLYKITNFEGGINNKNNQRDIADNQLVNATGVDLSVVGGIKMGGSSVTNATIQGTDPNAGGSAGEIHDMKDAGEDDANGQNLDVPNGNGLFTFNSDFDLDGEENSTSMLVTVSQDHSNNTAMAIFDPKADLKWCEGGPTGMTDKTMIDFGGDIMPTSPAFYFSNNGLRVSAGTNSADGSSNRNVNKCLYHTAAVDYFHESDGSDQSGNSDDADYQLAAGWYLTDQEIKAPPVYGSTTSITDLQSAIIMHRNPATEDGTRFDNHVDVADTAQDEKITDLLNVGGLGFSYTCDTTKGTWTGIWAIYYSYVYYDMDFGAESPVTRIHYGEIHSNDSTPVSSGAFMTADWTNVDTPVAVALDNDTIKFRVYIRTGKVSDANSDGTMDTSDAGAHNFPSPDSQTANQANPDARIVGMRVYARRLDKTSIGTPYTFAGDYLHLVDISFKDGIRKFTDKHYTGWGSVANNTYLDNGVACCPSDGSGAFFEFENPPSLTYQDINGYPADDIIHADQYKTAVVINRQAYIGNIRQDGRNYPDRIMVSPLDKPDVFPKDYFLDIASNDGDSIIHLESHGDRLFCYKKNKLFIINVANYDAQYLEAEYDNMGVSNRSQVAKMPTGIVWVNDTGCWIFDGSNVNNAIKGKIDQNTWSSFLGTIPSVAYDAKSKNIIVVKDCAGASNGDVYLFHTETQAWTFHDSLFSDLAAADARSNFVSVNGVPFCWFYDDDDTAGDNSYGQFESYSSAVESKTQFELLTKDIDFGQPGQRKRLYKAYVTYKCNGATNVDVQFATNGNTTFSSFSNNSDDGYIAFSGDELGNTSGKWGVAKLNFLANSDNAIDNIYSVQIKFFEESGQTVPADFEINDISIVYRGKKVN